MKTAISIPDAIFEAAEQHAKRSRTSRSRLYADALREYLTRHAPDEITTAMNGVIDKLGSTTPDPFINAAAYRLLKQIEW